jgi:hypothetical protein
MVLRMTDSFDRVIWRQSSKWLSSSCESHCEESSCRAFVYCFYYKSKQIEDSTTACKEEVIQIFDSLSTESLDASLKYVMIKMKAD